jgi:hypothetical protein
MVEFPGARMDFDYQASVVLGAVDMPTTLASAREINEKLGELPKPTKEKEDCKIIIRCKIYGSKIDRCEADTDCPLYLSCPWTSRHA